MRLKTGIALCVLGVAAIGSVFALHRMPITGVVDVDAYYSEQGNPRYVEFHGLQGERSPTPVIPPGHIVLKPNAVGHAAPAPARVAASAGAAMPGGAKSTGEGGNPFTPTGGGGSRPSSDAVRAQLRSTMQELGL